MSVNRNTTSIGPLQGHWRLALNTDLRLSQARRWNLFTEGPHSRLYRLDSGTRTLLAKCIRPRSQPRDAVRKYVNSQARREWHSAFRLHAAGLTVPAVHGWAYSLSPRAPYESILFMDEVTDYRSALQFIRHACDPIARRRFFKTLATDMARLHGHGLVHKDGHFDNIGRIGEHALIWIDNDIRRARTDRRLRAGFRHMRTMLHRTARETVSDAEWREFDQCLRAELARWPRARVLIDEVQ